MNGPWKHLVQEKLAHLRALIRQLALTPNGKSGLVRRVQLFGEWQPSPGESDRQYYGKLRHWLDRDLQN